MWKGIFLNLSFLNTQGYKCTEKLNIEFNFETMQDIWIHANIYFTNVNINCNHA